METEMLVMAFLIVILTIAATWFLIIAIIVHIKLLKLHKLQMKFIESDSFGVKSVGNMLEQMSKALATIASTSYDTKASEIAVKALKDVADTGTKAVDKYDIQSLLSGVTEKLGSYKREKPMNDINNFSKNYVNSKISMLCSFILNKLYKYSE